MSGQQVAETREFLVGWAKAVHGELGPQAIYLFGSLVYRDGAQFNDKSDVDLVVVMPEIPDAADRANWLEALLQCKVGLEDELGKRLRRADRSAILSSVVAVTSVEVSANIHKDGAAKFFSDNRFLNLMTGEIIGGLPDAGKRPIAERLVASAFGSYKKTRNAYLGANALGDATLKMFMDRDDAAPKQAMRHAAMVQFLEDDGDGDPGAEFDLDIGADKLTMLIHGHRKRLAGLGALYAARRGGRAIRAGLSAKDQLTLAELIFDAAIQVGARAAIAATAPKRPSMGGVHSTVLFAQRFADAFPGVRGVAWYDDQDDIRQRMARLLVEPLEFEDGTPIWWSRGPSNLQITSYTAGTDCLRINGDEMNLARVAAVNPASYKYSFVYVEVALLPPTGVYEGTAERIEETIQGKSPFPYYCEEYGLVDGTHLVTRAEADDGSAMIQGKLQSLGGRLEVRSRYVTKYNFVIAAGGAPLLDIPYDYRLQTRLNAMLKGEDRLSEIIKESMRLSTGRF